MMLRNDDALGMNVELYGPKEYAYKQMVRLFLDIAMRQERIISVDKRIARVLAAVWSAPLAFPIITPDEVERVMFCFNF